jgi:SAM-dependent methyltransferase
MNLGQAKTTGQDVQCTICGYRCDAPRPQDTGSVRGNTERFKHTKFRLWKCPECLTIIALDPVDFADIYADYPLNTRQLDVFARGTLANLLRRLRRAGLKPSDSILDYGCGNNIFVDYLQDRGYTRSSGYDPYVPAYTQIPIEQAPFDVIVNNDTLEHCEDIRGMISECLDLLKTGGLLYLGTADSEPVKMTDLEPEVMRLHQPFHRIILTEQTLHNVVAEFDVEIVTSYTRSYHDTYRPFSNYRFLNELNKMVGHNLDLAMDSDVSTRTFLRSPRLWFFALFGYWFPPAAEPAVIVRKLR